MDSFGGGQETAARPFFWNSEPQSQNSPLQAAGLDLIWRAVLLLRTSGAADPAPCRPFPNRR